MTAPSNASNGTILDEIRAKCLEESKRSLKNLCRLTGVSYEEMQTQITKDRRSMILAVSLIKGGDNYRDHVDAYYKAIDGMDFWEITEYHHRHHEQDAYEALETIFEVDLIERGYVISLAQQLGMNLDDYQSYGAFIRAFSMLIPHIYLYEYEFDAFLAGRSRVKSFPAVVFYQTLFGVLQNLAAIIVRNLFNSVEKDGKQYVQLATSGQIAISANDVFIKLGLQTNIDVLIGKKALSAIPFNPKPGVEAIVDAVQDLANKFVTLHEYGHLFRGHLASGHPRVELEYDADYFAIAALSRFAAVKQLNSYVYNLAIAIVFFCLHIRDVYYNTPQFTHPPAVNRFERLVKMMNNRDPVHSPEIFWEKIRQLVGPTLEDMYQIVI